MRTIRTEDYQPGDTPITLLRHEDGSRILWLAYNDGSWAPEYSPGWNLSDINTSLAFGQDEDFDAAKTEYKASITDCEWDGDTAVELT